MEQKNKDPISMSPWLKGMVHDTLQYFLDVTIKRHEDNKVHLEKCKEQHAGSTGVFLDVTEARVAHADEQVKKSGLELEEIKDAVGLLHTRLEEYYPYDEG
jgi:hypothetical protein